ncbi:MAG TPA: class I SAM-dependent methyltransferase [Chitinophagaceae bacterium]|nr:class I SAM-dependent methyltransferase [Chitinophagaceae bacterium]
MTYVYHKLNVFNYIRYFFYLAFNWNPVLACFVIYHELRGEKKYKLHTSGYNLLKKLIKEGVDISHATMYMPANYFVLEKLFNKLTITPGNNCIVDIGCGKGRVLIVAAYYGFKKITGVEFSKTFCARANQIIQSKKSVFPDVTFGIVNQDAATYIIPDETTTIFLYNPFDEEVMKKVILNIEESLNRKPRSLIVIYVNPQAKHLFLQSGFKEIFYCKKLKYLEGCILEKKPG